MEPWLKVSFVALATLALGYALPRALQLYLFVAGALLVLCGIIMLVKQETRKRPEVRE
jgi:hypothetical protein